MPDLSKLLRAHLPRVLWLVHLQNHEGSCKGPAVRQRNVRAMQCTELTWPEEAVIAHQSQRRENKPLVSLLLVLGL